MKKYILLPAVLMAIICVTACVTPREQLPADAVPIEPISGIIDAFKVNSLVALSEGDHGNLEGHKFRMSLIRDPRFSAVANDIVVEFGSARYQNLMDRFINGEDTAEAELRHVWQDTTQQHDVWDCPIYEEFFREVREVNRDLPKERKLRVLLGDPPIDWSSVHKIEDLDKWMEQRDSHAAKVIQQEVLAKKRRALLIYGGGHFYRKDPFNGQLPESESSILVHLFKTGKPSIFNIWTHSRDPDIKNLQANIAKWSQPSLTVIRGTKLGSQSFVFYHPDGGSFWQGKPIGVQRDILMQDEFDAILYLAPSSTITYCQTPAKICADPVYMEMRRKRMFIGGGDPFFNEVKKILRCGSSSSTN